MQIMKKLLKLVVDSKYRTNILAGHGFYDHLSDEEYLKKLFLCNMDEELDLNNPQTFNEKLQWLKLHNRKPEYTIMVDKYKVREYIADKIGEEYLIPLLGAWDDPDEIDFDTLPNQFVLKCNHNSGRGMCICKDKSKRDIARVKQELRKGIKQDYYLAGREWPYKDVPRKIIAEPYMEDVKTGELRDYKLFCFNGEPRFTLVCSQRFSKVGLREDFFDINWVHLPIKRPNVPNSEVDIDKPVNYDHMLKLARQLSENIPFVRVDFYEINEKIYFGEMTFYPASGFLGFEPNYWDTEFGKWIKLLNILVR